MASFTSRSIPPPDPGARRAEARARVAARLAEDLARVASADIGVGEAPWKNREVPPAESIKRPSLRTAGSRENRPLASDALATAWERIDRLDPDIRAWVALDREGARAAAAAADARASTGRRQSPVDGVPVGIKDLIDTAGLATSYGSPIFQGHVPERDAAVVAKLREAGAVVVGKTVTTEFATYDPGPTRNPWHRDHTPGGSSSGSAAAVAAGMVPMAVGTQTGGSTIRPASYCGVVGYLPTAGLVDRAGIFPCSWTLDRVGVFARSVGDAADLAGCLVEAGATGSHTQPPPPRRVGVIEPLTERATDEMRGAVDLACALLRASGRTVERVTAPFLGDLHAAHAVIMRAEIAAVHRDLYARHADGYGPEIGAIVAAGATVTAGDYLAALRLRQRLLAVATRVLEEYEVLVAPAAVGAADASLETIGDPVMNLFATFTGAPAITTPAALGDDGLPLGVQLIGASFADSRLLATAAELEQAIGFEGLPDRSLLDPR